MKPYEFRKEKQEAYTRFMLRYLSQHGFTTVKILHDFFGLKDIKSVRLKVKCLNVSELRRKLSTDFKSSSVAIHKQMPSGIISVDYVEVDDKGDVVYSYGNKNPFFHDGRINGFD